MASAVYAPWEVVGYAPVPDGDPRWLVLVDDGQDDELLCAVLCLN